MFGIISIVRFPFGNDAEQYQIPSAITAANLAAVGRRTLLVDFFHESSFVGNFAALRKKNKFRAPDFALLHEKENFELLLQSQKQDYEFIIINIEYDRQAFAIERLASIFDSMIVPIIIQNQVQSYEDMIHKNLKMVSAAGEVAWQMKMERIKAKLPISSWSILPICEGNSIIDVPQDIKMQTKKLGGKVCEPYLIDETVRALLPYGASCVDLEHLDIEYQLKHVKARTMERAMIKELLPKITADF